jgi:hypothetical protein
MARADSERPLLSLARKREGKLRTFKSTRPGVSTFLLTQREWQVACWALVRVLSHRAE